MAIIRFILALQCLEVVKCTVDIIGIYVYARTEAGCRVFVFFRLVLLAAPLNLSVFCVLYFQALLIHNLPLNHRRPRAVAVALLVAYGLIPETFVLFIPPHIAGIDTYCRYMQTPSRRLFIFEWLTYYTWVSLACLLGIYAIASMVWAIVKSAKQVKRRMYAPADHHHNTGSSHTLNAMVVKESVQQRRSSHTVIVRTLRTMIWFPVVPIVYLGFNTVYSIVWYRSQKESLAVFMVDRALQFLASPLFALTFYLNPSVKRALRQYMADRRHRKPAHALSRPGTSSLRGIVSEESTDSPRSFTLNGADLRSSRSS